MSYSDVEGNVCILPDHGLSPVDVGFARVHQQRVARVKGRHRMVSLGQQSIGQSTPDRRKEFTVRPRVGLCTTIFPRPNGAPGVFFS
jgi:hypothetical protein